MWQASLFWQLNCFKWRWNASSSSGPDSIYRTVMRCGTSDGERLDMPLRLTCSDLVFSYSLMMFYLLYLCWDVVQVPKLPVVLKVEDDTDPRFRQIHLVSKGVVLQGGDTTLDDTSLTSWRTTSAPRQLSSSTMGNSLTIFKYMKHIETWFTWFTCHSTPSYPETERVNKKGLWIHVRMLGLPQIWKFDHTINQSNSKFIFQTLVWTCHEDLWSICQKIICLKLQLDT